MALRIRMALAGVLLLAGSAAFADNNPFTVTADFTTLAGQNEVIFGYAPLVNTTGSDLFTDNLNVNFATGQGSFDQVDAADGFQYGFSYPTIFADNTLNTPGFMGLYLAPLGFSGPVALTFDIGTIGLTGITGPDYVATYSFNYPPRAVPEPGTWALVASEGVAGLFWIVLRRRRRSRSA